MDNSFYSLSCSGLFRPETSTRSRKLKGTTMENVVAHDDKATLLLDWEKPDATFDAETRSFITGVYESMCGSGDVSLHSMSSQVEAHRRQIQSEVLSGIDRETRERFCSILGSIETALNDLKPQENVDRVMECEMQ